MSTTAPLAEIMGTLDELATAAGAADAPRYRAALTVAAEQNLTDEQITDAHEWGQQRGQRVAPFDRHGDPRGSKP